MSEARTQRLTVRKRAEIPFGKGAVDKSEIVGQVTEAAEMRAAALLRPRRMPNREVGIMRGRKTTDSGLMLEQDRS